MSKVAYLGPPGTHTHRAALALYQETELIPYSSIPLLTTALERGEIGKAVLPLENSLEGTVSSTIDYLSLTSKLISAEIILDIEHVLAVNSGTKLEQIQSIASHPQALAQCSSYLARLETDTLPTASTVSAIKELANNKNMAVICSSLAANIYKLDILAENIADAVTNTTRFCLLSDNVQELTGNDKTSILFEIADRPGSLYEILRLFANANINLTKIESRPAKYRLGKYLFAIDFVGHIHNEEIKALLKDIETNCIFFKVLGSYPVCEY